MFNFYQNMNKKDDQDKGEEVIGHDRFYQERPSRSSVRKKKKITKRTKSVAEIPQLTDSAVQKRNAFSLSRSRSSENTTKSMNELITCNIFLRRSSSPKHEYSALRLDVGADKVKYERELRDGMYTTCSQYLGNHDRYELRTHLGNIGSRSDKHWFIVQDKKLDAPRLLTLVTLPPSCPIEPSVLTKETVLSLFRSLQHPYIHPVLDVEFWDKGVALVSPLNPSGSLRDIIYNSAWQEEYHYKYHSRGEGLPLRQIQCLGRQILEALLFLKNRHFPPFHHLTSSNIIIQNGVARLAALENPLFGLPPKNGAENVAFGRILYEMTVGYEISSHHHFDVELASFPKIAEVLQLIFKRNLSVEEILRCDLFRGVELRELRGANTSFTMPGDVLELLENVRCVPDKMIINKSKAVSFARILEDIIEEEPDSVSLEIVESR
ncbi:slowpoke-binding protein isoform X2 [Onthophagus taurus]|uniref:slowpoke-binding protein isoform X2 n=1 Tax=Onthophagus taurus TaxID=166361 RepID=UPI0039BE6199